METVTYFIFLGSKITKNGDCTHETEKSGLNLNIQKTKIMASDSTTSWQIHRKTKETVTDFIFLGSKVMLMVTAAMKLKDTCSLEEKIWQT